MNRKETAFQHHYYSATFEFFFLFVCCSTWDCSQISTHLDCYVFSTKKLLYTLFSNENEKGFWCSFHHELDSQARVFSRATLSAISVSDRRFERIDWAPLVSIGIECISNNCHWEIDLEKFLHSWSVRHGDKQKSQKHWALLFSSSPFSSNEGNATRQERKKEVKYMTRGRAEKERKKEKEESDEERKRPSRWEERKTEQSDEEKNVTVQLEKVNTSFIQRRIMINVRRKRHERTVDGEWLCMFF